MRSLSLSIIIASCCASLAACGTTVQCDNICGYVDTCVKPDIDVVKCQNTCQDLSETTQIFSDAISSCEQCLEGVTRCSETPECASGCTTLFEALSAL